MLNPMSPAALFAIRLVGAAHRLVPSFTHSARLDRAALNTAMANAFGVTAASCAWTQRDSFIAAEIAQILRLKESGLSSGRHEALAALNTLARLLPTQTVRSEEQIALQHFSTPLALSWFAAQMAAISDDDIALERNRSGPGRNPAPAFPFRVRYQ
jgi:hypothetical protein